MCSSVGHSGKGRGSRRAEVLAGYHQRARTRGCRLTPPKERELLGDGLDDAGMGRCGSMLLAREGVAARSLAEVTDIAQRTRQMTSSSVTPGSS